MASIRSAELVSERYSGLQPFLPFVCVISHSPSTESDFGLIQGLLGFFNLESGAVFG